MCHIRSTADCLSLSFSLSSRDGRRKHHKRRSSLLFGTESETCVELLPIIRCRGSGGTQDATGTALPLCLPWVHDQNPTCNFAFHPFMTVQEFLIARSMLLKLWWERSHFRCRPGFHVTSSLAQLDVENRIVHGSSLSRSGFS